MIVILGHIDYLLKLQESSSPYDYATYSISQLKGPLSSMKRELKSIKRVGKALEKIILEILDIGSSSYYKKLLTEQI